MRIYHKMRVGDKVRFLDDFVPEDGVVLDIEPSTTLDRLIKVKLICGDEVCTNVFEWEILELY